MTCAASIQLSPELIVHRSKHTGLFEKGRLNGCNIYLSSYSMRHDTRGLDLLTRVHMPIRPVSSKFNVLVCRSALLPTGGNEIPLMKSAAVVLTRTYTALCGKPFVFRLIPAVGVIAFAVWGIGPLMRLFRVIFFQRSDKSWMKSRTYYIVSSYLRPSLLCIGATLLCRALDLIVLPSEASQAVKQRILHFVRTLSTVLAFAYFLSSLIQQARNFFMEMNDSSDAKNMGFDLAGKAAFTAVWIAAVSLFMELLGFSTKWLTFGGFGTVLITLAGREILTNFLSSVMIHATKPFVVNEWIQTKIEGNEVSGTVEEVGWWKPTIVRGDDREKLYIPNHKFSASVVRNLSQKTHWRIKTHLAISYLDANKVANIVADMRKVLAKNPQVEQKKLHRRVYLETINPENPALMILISCFVRTSHIEEYLRVKEVVLLDLLGVISHHKARLATPIRRIQKMYNEADLDDIPFTDPIFSGRASRRVPLMIEPPYKIYGDEKDQPSTRSGQINGEKDKVEAVSTLDPKANPDSGSTVDSKEDRLTALQSVQGDSTITKQPGNDKSENEAAAPPVKQDAERRQPASATVNKTALEDNILLGVALDGSKRTLPIGDETSPKDTQVPLAPGTAQNDK